MNLRTDPAVGARGAPQTLQLDLMGPTSNEGKGGSGRGKRGEGQTLLLQSLSVFFFSNMTTVRQLPPPV